MRAEPGPGTSSGQEDVVIEDIDVDRVDVEREDDASSGERGLLEGSDGDAFRERWDEIQVRFVDEPRGSVERADELVAEVMQRLTTTFDDERKRLEARWDRGDEVSTEDLRIALQRYRSFFARLLAA